MFAFLWMTACDKSTNNSYSEEHEGAIVQVEKVEESGYNKGWYYALVISDIKNSDVSDMTEEELVTLAQENDGAYYNIRPDVYNDLGLGVGTQIVVYYDGQGDIAPPVREAERVEVISP